MIFPIAAIGMSLIGLGHHARPELTDAANHPSRQVPDTWRDPSPHTARRIVIATDVSVEVLDWGGTGEPILLLAGLGNTAHVFDDFAPRFTDRFRVLGVTRRGFGASSQPATGYDIETRVSDLIAVLDTLHLRRVHLIGHSIAGDELTGLAARHPDRVDRLVYLDAASDHRVTITGARPRLPAITGADSASPAAVQRLSSRLGQPVPEAEIRATTVFGADGRPVRDVTSPTVFTSIMQGLESPPYARVRAPALAFVARYESPTAVLSAEWWGGLDLEERRTALATLRQMAARSKREAVRFRANVRLGRIIELHGANHFVWTTHADEVARGIRSFLEPRARRRDS